MFLLALKLSDFFLYKLLTTTSISVRSTWHMECEFLVLSEQDGFLWFASLFFDAHARDISSEVFCRLISLWPNHYVLSQQVRLMLVESLILLLFTYCDSVYTTKFRVNACRNLERAFDAYTRFGVALKRRDRTQPYCGLPSSSSIVGERSWSRVLILPRHSTSQYNKSFFVSAAVCYNAMWFVEVINKTYQQFNKCPTSQTSKPSWSPHLVDAFHMACGTRSK